MRSIIALILITTVLGNSLIPSLGFEQSTKISEVFKHFKEHNLDEEEKLGFWKFIQMHYNADSKHFDSNKSEHQTLPNLDLSSIALFLVEGFFVLEFFLFSIHSIKIKHSLYKNLYKFSLINLLYGPPKY